MKAEEEASAADRSIISKTLFDMVEFVGENFNSDAENRLIIEEKLFEIVEEIARTFIILFFQYNIYICIW